MKTNVKINGQTVEIELTKEQINQLQKATEPKSFKRWRAEKGERYWIALNCITSVLQHVEEGDDTDNYFYTIGDYFKTKEEAEESRNAALKKQEILDFIREKNEGWVPVFDGNIENYCLEYSEGEIVVDSWLYACNAPTSYYFKSKEIGKELIEKFGDDLNYLFV